MKNYVISAVAGFFGFMFLLTLIMVAGTVLADINNLNSFTIGKGFYLIYEFNRTDSSFGFQTGFGVILVSMIGGLLAILLKRMTQRLLPLK
jgi:hypothetical protein